MVHSFIYSWSYLFCIILFLQQILIAGQLYTTESVRTGTKKAWQTVASIESNIRIAIRVAKVGLFRHHIPHVQVILRTLSCIVFLFMWPCILTKFFLIKPTNALIFPNSFLSRNSTCFGQLLWPSSGFLHCTFGTGTCHANLKTAFEHFQDGTAVPSWTCLKVVIRLAWHISVPNVQCRTPDDGQRNCPKYVEFLDKLNLEKLVRLLVLLKRMLSSNLCINGDNVEGRI